MKVKFCCDNNANVHSKRVETFDTESDFGLTDKKWHALSEDKKLKLVEEWALEGLDYWFQEGEEE